MSWRYARVKRDGNEPAIVSALRSGGAVVVRHTPVLPRADHPEDRGLDLLVGWAGRTLWIEVKDPEARGRARRADEAAQREFCATWPGGQAVVVTSVEEALGAVFGAAGQGGASPAMPAPSMESSVTLRSMGPGVGARPTVPRARRGVKLRR